MSDVVGKMIREVLGRKPDAEDYATANEFFAQLPDEILASPAAVADIVIRIELIRQFKVEVAKGADLVKQASWDAQQRIHNDLPKRIDKAADAALNRMRDKLPIDAADRVSRLLKWGAAWTLWASIIAASGGWILAQRVAKRDAMTQQAAVERDFNACIDAAEGAAVSTVGRGGNPVRYDGEVYRTHARSCAAEYADRRAQAS